MPHLFRFERELLQKQITCIPAWTRPATLYSKKDFMENEQNPPKCSLVCGVDECGIGSAIAEVYVASCILDPKKPVDGLADSKKLTPKRRKELSDQIQECALDFCIATASLEEIERLNILYASHLAMVRAVSGLKIKPDLVLIDGNKIPKGLTIPARAIVKGDATVPAISAASILAKVARDQAMMKYHQQYPQYGFDIHKGYLTRPHFAALNRFGPCPVHRKSYAPIRALLLSATYPRQELLC